MIKARIIGHFLNDRDRYNSYSLVQACQRKNIEIEEVVSIHALMDRRSIASDPNDVRITNVDLTFFSDPLFYSPLNVIMTQELDFIKQTSKVFINDVDSHREVSNKILMYDMLSAANVNIPRTEYVNIDAEDDIINEVVNNLGGYPVVIKAAIGAMGTNVNKCNNLQEIREQITKLSSSFFHTEFIIQEYIDIGGFTICARVIGNDIFPRFTLGSPYIENNFKSNILSGRSYIACKVTPELRYICNKAMSATGLDVARIDIFINNGKLSICEVNSLGSFLGSEMAWNEYISDRVVDLSLNKLDKL